MEYQWSNVIMEEWNNGCGINSGMIEQWNNGIIENGICNGKWNMSCKKE